MEGVIERQRGSRRVPDCFWNEGSYQGQFGEMAPPCIHVTDIVSRRAFSAPFAERTYTSSRSHMHRLVTIIQRLSC